MKNSTLGIALSAALIAATTPVIANECPFSGFYGGVQLGGSFLSGTETVSTSGSTTIGTGAVVSSERINTFSSRAVKRNSFAGDLFLGWGCAMWDPIYLSAEIFVKGTRATATNIDDANSSSNFTGFVTLNQDIATQVRSRLRPWEFGIDFRPGYLVCEDTLLYGRVGYVYNRFSLRTTTTYTTSLTSPAGVTTALPTNTLLVDNHRHTGALRLGLGLEQELCENFTLRTDYTFTRYRRVNTNGTNAIASAVLGTPVTSTVSNGTSSRLISHAFMIGLSYYW